MDVSDLLAITLKKKLKIKVAKWGTPKKIFKKNVSFEFSFKYVELNVRKYKNKTGCLENIYCLLVKYAFWVLLAYAVQGTSLPKPQFLTLNPHP